MKKLNFDDLKEKSNTIASVELLSTINGGLQNDCHVTVEQKPNGTIDIHVYK